MDHVFMNYKEYSESKTVTCSWIRRILILEMLSFKEMHILGSMKNRKNTHCVDLLCLDWHLAHRKGSCTLAGVVTITPILQMRIWRPRGVEDLLTDIQRWCQPFPDLSLISSVVWIWFWDHLRDMQTRESKSDSTIYYLLGDLGKWLWSQFPHL